jgi:hypothetical protein
MVFDSGKLGVVRRLVRDIPSIAAKQVDKMGERGQMLMDVAEEFVRSRTGTRWRCKSLNPLRRMQPVRSSISSEKAFKLRCTRRIHRR